MKLLGYLLLDQCLIPFIHFIYSFFFTHEYILTSCVLLSVFGHSVSSVPCFQKSTFSDARNQEVKIHPGPFNGKAPYILKYSWGYKKRQGGAYEHEKYLVKTIHVQLKTGT